jgi:hypothetical protein
LGAGTRSSHAGLARDRARGTDRRHERRRVILPLIVTTALPHVSGRFQERLLRKNGGEGRNRTVDTVIFSHTRNQFQTLAGTVTNPGMVSLPL